MHDECEAKVEVQQAAREWVSKDEDAEEHDGESYVASEH